MKKKFIIISFLIGIVSVVSAQQDAMFTKYMFNSLIFNPGYAGSQGYWDINATYRKQWLSLEGAPTTFSGAVDGNLGDNVGVGLTLFNDQIGADRRSDFSLNYAYRFRASTGKFGIGIKAGAAFFNTDFQKLNVDPGDPIYASDIKTTNPYAGVGFFYNSDKFYVGLSSPTLISIDLDKSDTTPKFLKPHFYANIGTNFSAGEKVELRPSLFASFQEAAPIQVHLNLTALFVNRLALGVSYRTGDALNINTVIFVNNHFRIGAAYDFTLSKLRTFNNGSFEVMLGYSFGKEIKKIQGVRNL